jgi:hypothetical protein
MLWFNRSNEENRDQVVEVSVDKSLMRLGRAFNMKSFMGKHALACCSCLLRLPAALACCACLLR